MARIGLFALPQLLLCSLFQVDWLRLWLIVPSQSKIPRLSTPSTSIIDIVTIASVSSTQDTVDYDE